MRKISGFIPRFLKRRIKRLLYFGFSRYCPVCESRLRLFQPFGINPRPDAFCPVCESLERHRFAWLFLKQKTDLFDGELKRMLHIAPEPEFERKFKKVASLDYLTADVKNPSVMAKIDITNNPYPAGSFDVIFCSHVLQHVQDDRRGIGEFYRVLKNGGWAVFLEFTGHHETVESGSVIDAAERERLFGAHGYFRRYGPDFKDRLEESGFRAEVFGASEIVGREDVVRMGVKDELIFFCRKKGIS